MFENIMAKIAHIVEAASLGGTGYIDGLPFMPAAKGEDKHGRKFFVIPVEATVITTGDGYRDEETGKAVATFFQRYSDDKDFWTEVGSHQGFLGGDSIISFSPGISKEEEKALVPVLEKLLAGETVTYEVPKKYHGWNKIEKTLRMLTPAEFPQK